MPLPIEKLLAVKTVITHKSCADGVASAIFLHDALPGAEIRFVQYGTDERLNLKPEPNMLFCDFSPHPKNYRPFIEAGAIILDHHAGEKSMVAEFGDNGVFGDEKDDPYACGALLAFREVWLPLQRGKEGTRVEFAKKIAQLASIRDTWKSKDPLWAEGCSVAETLRFFPEASWIIENPFGSEHTKWWDERLGLGDMLFKRSMSAVHKALEMAHRFTTPKGTRVVLFSGVRLSSDAAEVVEDTADFVVGFDYMGIENGVATLVFSTRSHTGYDCLAFCKANGGGGHTAAAGCSIKFDPKAAALDPYTTFERMLRDYEG